MRSYLRITSLAAALLLVPAGARADWYVFPFAAVNTGGDTTRESGAYGGSFGWERNWFSAEAELAWSPQFFDDDDGFRTQHRATTITGTALAGPWMGALRPYGALGLGVIRFQIEEILGLASTDDHRPALHAGGGLIWQGRSRLGLRGDVRYIRALGDDDPAENVFSERLGGFDGWRAGGGAVIRW